MKKLKAKIATLKESAKNKVLDAVIKRIALKPEDVASVMDPHEVACSVEVSQVAEHVAEMFSAEEIAENINVDDDRIVDAVAGKFDADDIASCIDVYDLSIKREATKATSTEDVLKEIAQRIIQGPIE